MADTASLERPGFRVEYYFFYGSLMDRSVLARVLQKQHRPEIYPATLKGWQCKMWGDYAALVHSPGYTTKGMAYEVRSPRERDCLVAYETDAYKIQPCLIDIGHGHSVQGKTFIWDDDTELLRYGTFDLKDWLLKQKEFEIQQFH